MPLKKFLTHLRRNVVAYLALVVALGTSTAYAAAAIPNGSVTAAKLHTNAVTSTKIKNGTIKKKDIRKPTYVQSTNLQLGTPPAAPDVVSIAPYDFTLPTKSRTSVTVFIPTIGGDCARRPPADHRSLHRQRADPRHRGQRAGSRQRPAGPAHGHARAQRRRAHRPGGHHLRRRAAPNNLGFAGREVLDDHPDRLNRSSALMGA